MTPFGGNNTGTYISVSALNMAFIRERECTGASGVWDLIPFLLENGACGQIDMACLSSSQGNCVAMATVGRFLIKYHHAFPWIGESLQVKYFFMSCTRSL